MVRVKEISRKGDYFCCNKCDKWHKYNDKKDSLGYKHLKFFDYNGSNAEDAEYYFCGLHRDWHSRDRRCFKYRAELSLPK